MFLKSLYVSGSEKNWSKLNGVLQIETTQSMHKTGMRKSLPGIRTLDFYQAIFQVQLQYEEGLFFKSIAKIIYIYIHIQICTPACLNNFYYKTFAISG